MATTSEMLNALQARYDAARPLGNPGNLGSLPSEAEKYRNMSAASMLGSTTLSARVEQSKDEARRPPNFNELCAAYEAAHKSFMAGARADNSAQRQRVDTYYRQFIDAEKEARDLRARPAQWHATLRGAFFGAAFVALLVWLFGAPAKAHQAPSGWQYPYECCSDNDCYQIMAQDIEATDEGYLIKASRDRQIVPWSRVRTSPDGGYHRCSVGGDPEAWTLCLFVPEGS